MLGDMGIIKCFLYLPILFLPSLMATILTPIPMGVVPTTVSNSPALSGCPIILTLPGDDVRSHRLRAQSYKTAPLDFRPWLAVLLSAYRSEVPKTPPPSLDLIDLLEWLIKLRETFYLVDHQFNIKEYNSGTARWKRCLGQSMGTGHKASMPSPGTPLFPHFHVFINLEAPQTLTFWVFFRGFITKARLIKSLAVGDGTQSSTPLPSQDIWG